MNNWLIDLLLSIFIFGAMSSLLAAAISPLQFIKIRRQQTKAPYGEIVKETKRKGGIKRFFVGAKPYALMNFYSSGTFGLSEFLMSRLLSAGLFPSLFGILLRSLSGSVIETASTISAEVKEISRNKGELMEAEPKTRSILIPIFARNALFWLGPLSASYVAESMGMHSVAVKIGFALIPGMIFGLMTLPLDVVATRSCGAREEMSFLRRFAEVTERSVTGAYLGGLVRVMQIAIFTADTTCTEIMIARLREVF